MESGNVSAVVDFPPLYVYRIHVALGAEAAEL